MADEDIDLQGYNALVETLQEYLTDSSSNVDLSGAATPQQQQPLQQLPILWSERCSLSPAAGTIRLLVEPAENAPWAGRDFSLSQWITLVSANTEAAPIFYKNQEIRWRAKAAMNRWRHTLWMRKTQCNVDMIDMAPIPAADAVFVTDVANRQVFRFHRRDVFNSLLSNICMSDDMMPYPRPPTNPWTNQVLTLTQTISICQQLVSHYGRQGRCPPVLFAAFCASRYDVQRFQNENSSLLAQHAIVSYFKDLTDENGPVVEETMINLLNEAGLDFSPTAIRRWLQARPMTPLHREWVTFVQDYTLFMNLHVQVRPNWRNRSSIRHDVAELYSRTTIPAPTRTRVLQLQPSSNLLNQIRNVLNNNHINENEYAIQLLRNALFRY